MVELISCNLGIPLNLATFNEVELSPNRCWYVEYHCRESNEESDRILHLRMDEANALFHGAPSQLCASAKLNTVAAPSLLNTEKYYRSRKLSSFHVADRKPARLRTSSFGRAIDENAKARKVCVIGSKDSELVFMLSNSVRAWDGAVLNHDY